MKGGKSILDEEPRESIEFLAQPSGMIIQYPEQQLPIDNYPAMVLYKSKDVEIEISDIKEGSKLEGILFGRITITGLPDETKTENLSAQDEKRKGSRFVSAFYVPLLDPEKIIDYLLHGLSKDEINGYQRQWFEPLQQALRPCNDFTLRNAAYNDDPILDMLKVEGLKTSHTFHSYKPTLNEVGSMIAKAMNRIDVEFDGFNLANARQDTRDIN